MYKFLILATLLLTGCERAALQSSQTENTEFTVDFLFEKDGCKVYRFRDAGERKYFTSCKGSTMSSERHYCGKNCTRHEEVEIPTSVRGE